MHEFSKSQEVVEPTVDRSIYRHVVELGLVVKDLDQTVNHWERLGFKNIHRRGTQNVPDITYRGKKSALTLKLAEGDIGGVRIKWIEPVKGISSFDNFLERHGDGVHHIVYSVKGEEELENQVEYFRAKGIGILMEALWTGAYNDARSVYLETAERGAGITFALTCDPGICASDKGENTEPFNSIAQYAVVARDLKKTAAFYESLGFGSVPIDCIDFSNVPECYYRSNPGKFAIYTNQWRWGSVPFEWIQPCKGTSVFEEYLNKHGEGIHHLAFTVMDLDKTLKAMAVEVAQSGRFSYQNRRGRFAYIDMEPFGGVMIEFIWREPKD